MPDVRTFIDPAFLRSAPGQRVASALVALAALAGGAGAAALGPGPAGLAAAVAGALAASLLAHALIRVPGRRLVAELRQVVAAVEAHTVVARTDAAGVIVEVNARSCELSGYSREELVGRTHRVISSGHHDPGFWAEMWRTVRAGRTWRGEICNRAKDGSLYWADTTIVPLFGSRERPHGYLALRNDITALKLAQADLVASRARLEATLAALPDLLFETDAEGVIHDYRAPDREALFTSPERFLGQRVQAVLPPSASEPILATVRQALESGVRGRTRYQLELAEGLRTFELSLSPRSAGPGEPSDRCIALARDVTDRVRVEEALAEERLRLAAFVEHAPAAIAMFDRELRYVSVSRRWNEEFGLGERNLLGLGHYEVFPEVPQRWKEINARVLAGAVERCADDVWRPPGWDRDQHLRWEVRPWHTADGSVGGIVMYTQDITADRERERELARLKDAALAASQAKSEFLANMSHEIRTPLSAMLGYAEILGAEATRSEPDVVDRRVQMTATMQRAGDHLLRVINDILDLSKIEAGRLTVESSATDLRAVLCELDSLLGTRARAKDVRFECALGTPLPGQVWSDPTRLRQILMNLAGNAVKFTDEGVVRVRAEALEPAPGETAARLRFDVIDSGPGMAADLVGLLFEPFAQADGSSTRRHGGTGLGLAISRRLAEMLGGSVELISTAPGAGAHFRLELPLVPVAGCGQVTDLEAVAAPLPGAQRSEPNLAGRVLLAEDGADNRRLVSFHLERAGASVDTAENGVLALERALAAQDAGQPYDLLLTDIQMPEMDGYGLTRELRRRGLDLPIVALTAHAMAEDRQRCLDAGCDDYASKPVRRDELLRVVSLWLGRRSVRGQEPKP